MITTPTRADIILGNIEASLNEVLANVTRVSLLVQSMGHPLVLSDCGLATFSINCLVLDYNLRINRELF